MNTVVFGYDLRKLRNFSVRPNPTSRPHVRRFGIFCAVVGALLLSVAAWFFWKRYAKVRAIAALESSIPVAYRLSEATLKEQLKAEQTNNAKLGADWTKIADRLTNLRLTYEEVARDPLNVDYKRERYRTMVNLNSRAFNPKTQLPKNEKIGIPNDLSTSDNPARRMVQLHSAGALMGAALDSRMDRVESVRLLDPIERLMPIDGGKTKVFAVEFPIEIVATGDLDAVGRWMLAAAAAKDINGKENFFIVRNVKAEKAAPAEPDMVRATLVFTALLVMEIPKQFELPKEKDNKALPYDDS